MPAIGAGRSPVRGSRGPAQNSGAPIVLFIGAPGSGKGTQARQLASNRGLVHIEMGEQLRNEMKHHSQLGRRIAHYVEAGALVPSILVRAELAATFQRKKRAIAANGAILDGYPRNLGQAKDLLHLLRDASLHNALVVVNLGGPDRLFITRLLGRGRSDDTPAVIRRRLHVFHKATAPMLRFLRSRLPVIDIAADAPVSAVGEAIQSGLDDYLRHTERWLGVSSASAS